MEDPEWEDDVPWWYNERAVLSMFVGAIWLRKGWAVEEFATEKRNLLVAKIGRSKKSRVYGRGDLEFWLNNKSYVAEVKSAEPSMQRGEIALARFIEGMMTRAIADARRHPVARGYQRLGVLFLAPCLKKKGLLTPSRYGELYERARRFVKVLEDFSEKTGCVAAWTFPFSPKRKPPDADGYLSPGAVVLIADSKWWRASR
jgi:hypothetical protein